MVVSLMNNAIMAEGDPSELGEFCAVFAVLLNEMRERIDSEKFKDELSRIWDKFSDEDGTKTDGTSE